MPQGEQRSSGAEMVEGRGGGLGPQDHLSVPFPGSDRGRGPLSSRPRDGAWTWAPLLPPKVTLRFPVSVFTCFPLKPQTPGQENCFIFNLHVPISGPRAWHDIGTQEMFVKHTNTCCLGLECPLLEEESMAVSWILAGTVEATRPSGSRPPEQV